MEEPRNSHGQRSGCEKMQIVIIGAGLGGLGAAISIQNEIYQVTILETSAQLAFAGAGIQFSSPAVKIFQKWGIAERLFPLASKPVSIDILRYADGSYLGGEPDLDSYMHRRFGATMWQLHRADVAEAMYDRAVELGVEVRFGCTATAIDGTSGTVMLESGEKVASDLIIGADGLHSKTRASFLGKADPAVPTGDLAYRIVLDTDRVTTDTAKAVFAAGPPFRIYLGPGGHVVLYTVRGGKQINIVLLVPDDLPSSSKSRVEGNVEEMKQLFENWDPVLREFLSMVKSVDKWRLQHHPSLDSWHHPSGKFVLLGDSVHPMLPYMAQGGGSAIEDAAVLGASLHRIPTPSEGIKHAIQVYEAFRKPRSEKIAAWSYEQKFSNHLPDGEEQRQRDEVYKQQLRDGKDERFPWFQLNPVRNEFLYSYDAYADIEKRWDEISAQVRTKS